MQLCKWLILVHFVSLLLVLLVFTVKLFGNFYECIKQNITIFKLGACGRGEHAQCSALLHKVGTETCLIKSIPHTCPLLLVSTSCILVQGTVIPNLKHCCILLCWCFTNHNLYHVFHTTWFHGMHIWLFCSPLKPTEALLCP